jgi:hypothetical protein
MHQETLQVKNTPLQFHIFANRIPVLPASNRSSNLVAQIKQKIVTILQEAEVFFVSYYSHSIVAGGLELMSYTTRFTPLTRFMISLEISAKKS